MLRGIKESLDSCGSTAQWFLRDSEAEQEI